MAPCVAMPSPVLDDRYELQEVLGSGSTAEVHRALDRNTGRVVAVKFLVDRSSAIPQARERFVQEATLLARIRSPHIVPVLDFGTRGDHPYLVMELLECTDLAQHLENHGALAPEEARRVGLGIARGIRALHEVGVTHRDLKPANILLDSSGDPLIADLGLASDRGDSKVRTRTGMIMGSPGFISPEMLSGKPVGPPADLYALGILLFTIHTARLPFTGGSHGEIFQDQLRGVSRDSLEGFPVSMARLVAELAQNDPARRPSIDQALAALEGHEDDPTQTSPTRIVPRLDTLTTEASLARETEAWDGGRRRALAGRWAGALVVGVAALASWVHLRPASRASLATSEPARGSAVQDFLDEAARLSFRGELLSLLGGDDTRALDRLVHGPGEPVDLRLARVDAHLAQRAWRPAFDRLVQELPPTWWDERPPPQADRDAHHRERHDLARALVELAPYEHLVWAMRPGDEAVPALPGLAAVLDPAVQVRYRMDLPDRADEVPGTLPLIEGCQPVATEPDAVGRVAGMALSMAELVSCPQGLQKPKRQEVLELPPEMAEATGDLEVFFGVFSPDPWNMPRVALLDEGDRVLAEASVCFSGHVRFGRLFPGSGEGPREAAVAQVRFGRGVHAGRARRVRFRVHHLYRHLDPSHHSGFIIAGVAVRAEAHPSEE